jgi:glycosyltransferase involved in cell wall biosynthesis
MNRATPTPNPNHQSPVAIVVPVYNEADALDLSLVAFRQVLTELPAGSEVIFVDDGSTDGSGQLLANLVTPSDPIRIIRHARNRGYGAALKTGVRATQAHLVCICDADGTYPIRQIPALVTELLQTAAAMVVGARPKSQQPAIRRPAKAALTWLAQYLTNERIPDLNSGLRVMRRNDLLRLEGLLPNGFSYTTTITVALLSEGERVLYRRINYRHRIGTSKIRPIHDTLNFLLLILRTTLAFAPLKVFGPVGLALVAGGILLLTVRLFLDNPFGVATTVILMTAGLQILMLGLLADLVNRRGR